MIPITNMLTIIISTAAHGRGDGDNGDDYDYDHKMLFVVFDDDGDAHSKHLLLVVMMTLTTEHHFEWIEKEKWVLLLAILNNKVMLEVIYVPMMKKSMFTLSELRGKGGFAGSKVAVDQQEESKLFV